MPLCPKLFSSRIILVFFFCLFQSFMVWADTEKNIEIELEGIEKDWSETLVNGLSINRQKNSPRLDSRSVQRLHEQAVDELKHMLTVYGYYSPEITAELTETDENNWLAQYKIDLGEPIIIRQIDAEVKGDAKTDPAFTKMLNKLPLKVGDHFDHQSYENTKKTF